MIDSLHHRRRDSCPIKQYLHVHDKQALKEERQTRRRAVRDSRSRGEASEVRSVSEYHGGHLRRQTSAIDNAKWEITQLREKCSNQSSAKPVLDGLYRYKRKLTRGVDSPPDRAATMRRVFSQEERKPVADYFDYG